MKYLKLPLLIIVTLITISCNNKSSYTITKLTVRPDSLYSSEASEFMDKKLTTEIHDNSLKLTIEGHATVFLKLYSQNHNYERTNNPMDYDMAYKGNYQKINFDLHILKEKDKSTLIELYLDEVNKNPTTYDNTSGNASDGYGAALMASMRNRVVITLRAK